jgi:trimeric autotransporter adhesin
MRIAALLIIACGFALAAQSQAPQALNYQAVARNGVGQIVPSQNIGVRFSVINSTATGTTVYQETHTTTTNNFGLFTLAIGRGTVVSGTFNTIDWGGGDKYLKVEIAPQGGTNYVIQGTTQLLSVPYALYSEKTRLLAGNNTITITNGNTITGNYVAGNNTIAIAGNAITGNYQAANNTILVNGNTIAGNYVAGNNTVIVNGNAITGNYQAANNTILVNGNTIAGNYVAGNNTVAIAGNAITGNYQAGTGIAITGNVISATGGSSLWTTDANGIHNTNANGRVGVNRNADPIYPFSVHQNNTGVGNAIAMFESDDTWMGAIGIRNNASNHQYSLVSGGTAGNLIMAPGSFGIIHANFTSGISTVPLVIDATTEFIGLGRRLATEPDVRPRSGLHLWFGDVNIEQAGSGIILKSPNGQCWRVTIDNAGNLVRTAIVCP